MKTDLDEQKYEYPYASAIEGIKNWREFVNQDDMPSAYFLHKEDLLFLINELMSQDAVGMGVRCYPSRDKDTGTNHLLMVAVVEDENYPNGKDLYYPVGTQSMIFDLTRPCPNMCDEKSALYLASLPKTHLPLSDLKPSREEN